MHRSLAHSAGAALVLAAVLTSAAPVAAHTAPGADGNDGTRSSCRTIRTERQSLEGVVWSLMIGSEGATSADLRCEDVRTVRHDGVRGVTGVEPGP